MSRKLFTLIGPSGSGKSMLITEALAAMPDRLAELKTCTTRPPRDPVSDRSYNFIDTTEFERRVAAGRFIEHDCFAGKYYGTDRQDIAALLKTHHGIKAMTEKGVLALIEAGCCDVMPIRINPVGSTGREDAVRQADDLERAKIHLPWAAAIMNFFVPGGKEEAVQELITFIRNVT